MSALDSLRIRTRYYGSLLSTDLARAYLMMPRADPGTPSQALDAAIAWICRAQDATGDGGVARSFAFVYNPYFNRSGWTASYPETTGYIIPTLFDYAALRERHDVFARALRMADWECDVQMASGAVQGGTIDQAAAPAIFNTGQVIFGWVRAFRETGNERYLGSAVRAGKFLVDAQDPDGAWRKSLSEYASGSMSSYTYNTRSAWALVQLSEATDDPLYRNAAVRNVRFALTQQTPSGWFRNNCLNDARRPLVHTIAYSLRGILEVALAVGDEGCIDAVAKAADALLARQREDGSLPGRFDEEWRPAVQWSCLTGNAQMGLVWGRLYETTHNRRYLDGLTRANRYLQRVQWRHTGNPGLDGGISGSYPVHGEYGRFEVLNWAAKFFADSLMLESALSKGAARAGSVRSELGPIRTAGVQG